jgi:hypothetical protein
LQNFVDTFKLYNKLHNFFSSTDIISTTKSRGMRWTGHVAHTGNMRNEYEILVGKPREETTW